MSRKRHNAKIPRRDKGRKEKRLECDAPGCSDGDESLESYARESSHTNKSILLFFSGAIVVFAIVIWRHLNTGSAGKKSVSSTNTSNASLSALFRIACKKTKLAYCEKGVFEILDETRTIRTRSSSDSSKPLLKKGQLLLEIPRILQITTLDALRDPRVSSLLRLNPRHPKSGKPLDPKALLALHMSFQLSQLRTNDIGNDSFDSLSSHEQVQRAYLEYLPTQKDFMRFHPVSRQIIDYYNYEGNIESTDPLSPSATLTDHLVDQYFRSFLSEYQALCGVSLDFQKLVSLEDWITSRLIVNTRSFQSDPLTEIDISNEELDFYHPFLTENEAKQEIALLDGDAALLFYDKCRKVSMRSSMVPLLDAFDHHPKENIGWEFMDSRSSVSAAKSFITYATKDVNPDSDLFDSYFRSRPDPFVFAQYGFLNSDGMGERAALIAPYHRLLADEFENDKSFMSSRISSRDDEMKRYVAFKDGYETCEVANSGDYEATQRKEFEVAKFEALKAISNIVNSWVAILPPRDDESGGDLGDILSMCRLLAMTHRDYGGRATEMLQTLASSDYPENFQFRVSSDDATSEGLEYRASHVLERLASEMRSRVVASLASMTSLEVGEVGVEKLRRKLESNENEISNWERSSISVRLGELETLTILCKDAEQYKEKLLSDKEWRSANGGHRVETEDYIVRRKPCQQ